MLDNLPQLTQRAQRVLDFAQEAANQLGDTGFGTEHLFLSLMFEDTELATRYLLPERDFKERGPDSVDQPRPLLILEKNGKVLNANEPAQNFLDLHGTEFLDGMTRVNLSEIELEIGDRTYGVIKSRLFSTGTLVIILDITSQLQGRRTHAKYVASLMAEFKSPIYVIKTDAQLIAKISQLDDKQSHCVEQIISMSDKISQMVERVAESLPVVPERPFHLRLGLEPLDLKLLVTKTIAEVQHEASEKYVTIQFESSNADCRIWGDEMRLHGMVLNLIRNALEHSPDEELVKIALTREPSGIWLRVQNQGPAIPEDALPHILEQWFGPPPSQHNTFVVKAIGEAHGGKVEARNVSSGGVEFAVMFPAAIDLPSEIKPMSDETAGRD